MGEKGLCVNCINNTGCIFFRKVPVLFCEEFSDSQPAAKKTGFNCVSKQRNKTDAELVTAEFLE